MSSKEHPLTYLLRQLELYAGLPDEDRRLVLGLPHRLRRMDAGAYLVHEGDRPTQCTVLVSGYAYRQKVTGTGSRQILAVCIPGDAVDLQNMFLDVSDHSVQLLTQATVADVPREAMQELVLTRPAIGTAIIELTLVDASILREWVVNVGRRDARARIAHILCEFAVRLESRGLTTDDGFELPMTQEQLADATGLTSVHVNRVLKSLESEGLITRKRRQIHFDDWRALQDAGDFSRRYLHISDQDTLAQTL
ncbi:MAG: Crp/Fnr family transcriptional regulator [Myxococcales bacterium]|jgi:CRP-like cAMP-binding protein|nr:Crp/Fnr family transcriptional regulator [Sphingomicrobium sp.]